HAHRFEPHPPLRAPYDGGPMAVRAAGQDDEESRRVRLPEPLGGGGGHDLVAHDLRGVETLRRAGARWMTVHFPVEQGAVFGILEVEVPRGASEVAAQSFESLLGHARRRLLRKTEREN